MDYNGKNRGIILHSVKYGESGVILYMFTENEGRMSYFLRGGKNGKVTIAGRNIVLQPFTVLDFVATSNKEGSVVRIKEAKRSFLTASTVFDIRKSTISMFISEFLYKVIKESEPNQLLFDFICNSIKILDSMDNGVSNFHIYFVVKLSQFMGISPTDNYNEGNFFDLSLGRYTITRPQYNKHLSPELSHTLHLFQSTSIDSISNITLNRSDRVALLSAIITYYEYHNQTSYKIASLEIMSEIF